MHPTTPSEEREYVLGTDATELHRLRFQHEAWVEAAHALWRKAGLRAGHQILDLGSGPGFTTFDLALVAGPTGRVLALDESKRFLTWLEAERERRDLPEVETWHGQVEDLELEERFDAAYARWLFCWTDEPSHALRRVGRALKPGGRLAAHEYLDWATMKLVPRSAVFDRGIDACMASWADAGAHIDAAEDLVTHARASGLFVESFEPLARSGTPGSLVWRWLDGFFRSYLPRLVENRSYSEAERLAFMDEWEARSRLGDGHCVAPLMAEVLLRRPG